MQEMGEAQFYGLQYPGAPYIPMTEAQEVGNNGLVLVLVTVLKHTYTL